MSNLEISRVDLPSGVNMEFATGGGSGIPLVFLHGYSDSWFSFSEVAEALADRYLTILPTHRGHGGSSKPDEGYSIEAMARDVIYLLDDLKVDQAVFCGHSMGTFIAQEIAITHSDRVKSLSLIGGALSADNEVLRGLSDELVDFSEPVGRDFVEEFQTSTVAAPINPDMMHKIIDESLKMPARCWKPILDALIDYKPAKEASSIKAPVMIHWGDQDDIFPKNDQDELLRALPQAQFIVCEQVGHGLHWERALQYAADLDKFVQSGI